MNSDISKLEHSLSIIPFQSNDLPQLRTMIKDLLPSLKYISNKSLTSQEEFEISWKDEFTSVGHELLYLRITNRIKNLKDLGQILRIASAVHNDWPFIESNMEPTVAKSLRYLGRWLRPIPLEVLADITNQTKKYEVLLQGQSYVAKNSYGFLVLSMMARQIYRVPINDIPLNGKVLARDTHNLPDYANKELIDKIEEFKRHPIA
jgi:hypothetical protein